MIEYRSDIKIYSHTVLSKDDKKDIDNLYINNINNINRLHNIMRNFLARPTKKRTHQSNIPEGQSPRKEKQSKILGEKVKYQQYKKIEQECRGRQIRQNGHDDGQVGIDNNTIINQLSEIPIPINIVLVGNAEQVQYNDKQIAVKNSKQLQNCRKSLKQLFLKLFTEQGNKNKSSIIIMQGSQKSSQQNKSEQNSSESLSQIQLGMNQIIQNVSQIYQDSIYKNCQLLSSKQFKFGKAILKFWIHLMLSPQQIQKNKYNSQIDIWRALQQPKIMIFMYHASRREDQLLLHKFIKDAQYFYNRNQQDIGLIQKMSEEKCMNDKFINEGVTGIIVVDRAITINNYKKIEEWMSVEEGSQLAKKFNLLYMQVNSKANQEKNETMNILIAAALLKLNEFGLGDQVRVHVQQLKQYLQKYKQSNCHKEYKLLEKLVQKFSKMLLGLLSKIESLNAKIEQLLEIDKEIERFLSNNCYFIKYNADYQFMRQQLVNIENVKILAKRQQQNKLAKLKNIGILMGIYLKLQKQKQLDKELKDYSQSETICINTKKDNTNRFQKYGPKIDEMMDVFAHNIVLELISNKEQWFKQNVQGELKSYIQDTLISKQNKIQPNIVIKHNIDVIVDQLIELLRTKSQAIQIQTSDNNNNIYNKLKQHVNIINKILEHELSLQNSSITILKENNFNSDNGRQGLEDSMKVVVGQNSSANPTIKTLMNISSNIEESINSLLECLNKAYQYTKQYHQKLKQSVLAKIQWKCNVKLCIFHKIAEVYKYTMMILQEIKKYNLHKNKKNSEQSCLEQKNILRQHREQRCSKCRKGEDELMVNQYLIQYYLTKYHEELNMENNILMNKYHNAISLKMGRKQQIDQCLKQFQLAKYLNDNEDKQILAAHSQLFTQHLHKIIKILQSIHTEKHHQQHIKYQYLSNYINILNVTKQTRRTQLRNVVLQHRKKNRQRQKQQLMGNQLGKERSEKKKQLIKFRVNNCGLNAISGINIKTENFEYNDRFNSKVQECNTKEKLGKPVDQDTGKDKTAKKMVEHWLKELF